MRTTQQPNTVREGSGARAGTSAGNDVKLQLLKIMLNSRLNDEAEQTLKRRGQGHFQMSSEGHEALAGVAMAMKPEDWLHPHYRDRAIVIGRGVPHEHFFIDFYSRLGGFSGGRQMPVHYNSQERRIISLSSPVATNMLQAVGMAMSLKERKIPEVVVASIGDASTREGESLEAFAQAGVDNLPIVFLIEDNGYGISTKTEGITFWTMKNGLAESSDGSKWFYGCRVDIIDGLDPVAVLEASKAAIERARSGNGPTCLVTKLERLKSHSSSDDQRIYRSAEELKEVTAKDPVKRFIERCVKEKVLSQADVDALKAKIKAEIDAAVEKAKTAPEPDPSTERDTAFAPLPAGLPVQEQNIPKFLSKRSGGLTMAQCIDLVLEQEMKKNPRINLFGEDIEDPKGDVFGTTRGLSKHYPGRVKNSPLAEATIIGSAVGRAIMGDLPVSAIQFIDFMGPGLNQLFNEVVTLYWRSKGTWNCPMLIMAPYGAYLPGLGPWHSQTNEAIYGHIPGLHIAIPSTAADAAGLLRFGLRCNRPVLFLYPKALLHSAEDTVHGPSEDCIIPYGHARVVRQGTDVTVVTWGNCVNLCTAAAEEAARHGASAEIIDLRTLIPWDSKAVLNSIHKTGRLLVVHEDAKTCGFGGEIIAEVVAMGFEHLRAVPARITKSDDHNPYNYTLELAILPSIEGITKGIRDQCGQDLRLVRRSIDWSAGLGVPALREAHPPVAAGVGTAPEPAAVAGGTVDVEIPRQSPTDEDATVVKFLVKIGQKVKPGTPLAEMEANKGSFEVEATHEGTVSKLHAKDGDRVRVETPLVTLEVAAGTGTAAAPSRAATAKAPAAPAVPAKEIRLSQAQYQVGALALKSQLEIPTVDVECEADITKLVRDREATKDNFELEHGFRPTYTHFILWAMIQAMKDPKHEGFRGRLSLNGDTLLVTNQINVGFAAVGPEENLFSPVVKGAEAMDFVALSKRMQELTEKVRAGNVESADLQGASLTLTNIGAFEATRGTPFVIPGQLAMLAAGSILEKPRFTAGKGDERRAEPHMLIVLKLVFDHRPFNGSHAASFLRTIKHNLETMDVKALVG
jgi:2-oxoisovalerate dehydrogenase E1 component